MWSHKLYNAFKDDVSAIQWCYTMADGINYTGDLPRYVLDRLFDNLTDKSYWNVDDRNNVDMLRIITHEAESKFHLTIGVLSIAFVMSVIEKFTESLNTLTMKYELRNTCWTNTVVMIQSVPYYYVPIQKINPLQLQYVILRTKSQNHCDSFTYIYVHGLCDRNMGLLPASNRHFMVSPHEVFTCFRSVASITQHVYQFRRKVEFLASFGKLRLSDEVQFIAWHGIQRQIIWIFCRESEVSG